MRCFRSSETRLLLTCARSTAEPGTIQELARGNLHWGIILERATQLGVAPLIYSNLKKATDRIQVPKEIMKALGKLYYRQAAENMNLYLKLHEVLVGFSQEGIPVIVLKGAALAELVYQNSAFMIP